MCNSMELLREESLEKGRQEGRVLQLIEVYRTELHMDDETIRAKVAQRFGLPESEVSRFMQEPVELS